MRAKFKDLLVHFNSSESKLVKEW